MENQDFPHGKFVLAPKYAGSSRMEIIMSIVELLFNRKERKNKSDASNEKAVDPDTEADDLEEDEDTDLNKEPSIGEEPKKEEMEETYEVLEREILPAKIICPDCGGITLEGLDFCDKCGGELL